MMRSILTFSICLMAGFCTDAGAATMDARELAETQLLAEWVGTAAEQYKLGDAYYHGDGVPRDYALALKWYTKAADQGLAQAQFMMGVLYERGEGVAQDFVEAVGWYRKAASQGNVSAQFALGKNYAKGEGVPQNYTEAYIWFSLAAAAGHKKARAERDKYAAKLSREELIAAQQRATQLFEKSQADKTGG